MPSVDIPVERRAEYNELFVMLNCLVADLDDKIPLFFVITKDTESHTATWNRTPVQISYEYFRLTC